MSARCDTKIGVLLWERGLWIGRFQAPDLGADVELIVDGDPAAPDEKTIEKFAPFLSNAEENFLALRRHLSLAWSYSPIRMILNPQGQISVQFQSILPLVRRKMVVENGYVF